MKRCWIFRGSPATYWLANSKRCYAKTRRQGHFPHAKLGAAIPDIVLPEGVDPFGEVEGQYQDEVREEVAGDSTIDTRQGTLPKSPLMDPSFFEAREKHHKPKALQNKKPTPFQKQLAKNPYALALATPVRRCSLTLEARPRFFLEKYTLLPHPETGKPSWVPRGLTKKYTDAEDEESGSTLIDDCPAQSESGNGSDKSEQDTIPTPIHGHILARRSLLSALQIPQSGYNNAPQTLGRLLHEWEGSRKLVSHATFRPDMDGFVLELMRRRLVENLANVVKKQKGYIVGCSHWEDAKVKKQIGAIMWTVDLERERQRSPEFGLLMMKKGRKEGKTVPIYDMWRLLGKDHLKRVRELCQDSDILLLKHKNMTVEMQLKLWKLEGYLATHQEPEPEQASYGTLEAD